EWPDERRSLALRARFAGSNRPEGDCPGGGCPMTSIIAAVPPRRRRTDKIMRGVLLGGTLVALVPLVLVVYYLLEQGLGAISWDFFTTDPPGRFLGPAGGR